MFSSFYSIFLCSISTRFWMRKWRKTCSNAEVKSFAFTLDFGSHLLLSCPEINLKLYHIIWFKWNKDIRKIWFLPRETSVETFSWTPPKLGYSIGFGSPSSWKGRRSEIYWFCLVLPIPFSYFLYLFNQFWNMRLHSRWSLASLPIYKLGNSVTQIWHPSQLPIPSVLAYSSATCPKAKCQSNPKQCFFLVERWAFDWSGDLTLICGPIWQ